MKEQRLQIRTIERQSRIPTMGTRSTTGIAMAGLISQLFPLTCRTLLRTETRLTVIDARTGTDERNRDNLQKIIAVSGDGGLFGAVIELVPTLIR